MSPVRRATLTAQAEPEVNFGEPGFYSGALGLPEGNYAMTFAVQMFHPTKKDGSPSGTPPFLAAMVTAYPLEGGGEPSEHPLGMGQKAHLSFVPNATGTGLAPVPGGPATGLNDSTNWGIFLQSLRNCGLPPNVFKNDITVLDGIHVHTQNIPEPESRKQLRSQTGEAALQAAADNNRPKMVPTVTEIFEDGMPWNGTGGIPGQAAAPKVASKAGPKATAAPIRRAAPVAVAEPEPEGGEMSDEDVELAAQQAVTSVLEKNPNGCTKLAMKTGAFTYLQNTEGYGDDVAQLVQNTYFSSDANFNGILGPLGYRLKGVMVEVVK